MKDARKVIAVGPYGHLLENPDTEFRSQPDARPHGPQPSSRDVQNLHIHSTGALRQLRLRCGPLCEGEQHGRTQEPRCPPSHPWEGAGQSQINQARLRVTV